MRTRAPFPLGWGLKPGAQVLRRTLALLILASLSVPASAAPPPHAQEGGLTRACEESGNRHPCELAGIIPDTDVDAGETRTYADGTFRVRGTLRVHGGGALVVENATFLFGAQSEGILVDGGGALEIVRSTLEEETEEAPFRLDLAPGSSLLLNLSTLRGGHGVRLATSAADVRGNSFEQMPVALLLDHVELTIAFNQFLGNDVAVNETGGVTTLANNLFQGGTACVRNWLADPTIVDNVFRGCHTGIWHERSHSVITRNDMEDDALPPGTGIAVVDTNSPVIEGNSIGHYATGILVQNATASIRNNTVFENLGDGVRVQQNTQPMDIRGNWVFGNGGDGIRLISTHDIDVVGNEVETNAGAGVFIEGANATLAWVNATANGWGVRVSGLSNVVLGNVNASANLHDGFRVAPAPGALVSLALARAIGNGGDGLHATTGAGTNADGGWWEANGGAGVRNADANSTLPSECSYWGSASGPTHEENPGGTGDEVVGDVDHSPFATAPGAACPPTFLEGDE